MQKQYVLLHSAIDNNSSYWDFQVGLPSESTLGGAFLTLSQHVCNV
jgi:glutaminase